MSAILTKKTLVSLTEQETDRLETVIMELFASYPQVPMSELSIAVYGKHLAKIPIEDLEEIVDNTIDIFPKIPSIGDIVEYYTQLLELRAKAAAEAKRAQERAVRNSLKKQPSTEIESYLYALDHNIVTRQAKEEPLYKQLRVARSFGFHDDCEQLTAEIQAIRKDHKIIANQIIQEYKEEKPISYLKEIPPLPAMNSTGFGNATSIATSVLRQNMTVEVG